MQQCAGAGGCLQLPQPVVLPLPDLPCIVPGTCRAVQRCNILADSSRSLSTVSCYRAWCTSVPKCIHTVI